MTDTKRYRPFFVAEGGGAGIQSKGGMLLMFILIVALILSGIIYSYLLSDMMVADFSSPIGLVLFSILTIITFVAGHFILSKLFEGKKKNASNPSGLSSQSNPTYNAVRTAFYSSAFVHGIIIIEVMLTSQYHILLSIGTTAGSYLVGCAIVSFLSFRFFSWYKSKHDIMLLLYGLSYATIAIYLALAALGNLITLILDNPFQTEGVNTTHMNETSDSKTISPFLSLVYLIIITPGRISFIFYWAATALLLKHYSKYVGRAKFWTIISMPLVIFLIASLLIYSNYANGQFDRAILTITSLVLAGFFFSIIFITTATSLKRMKHEQIGKYLLLAGFGVFLFNLCTYPIHVIDWLHTPFPPFASSSWSFASLAMYIYAYGILYSAAAISRDIQLRASMKSITTSAKESKLFGTIGTAQMEQELTGRIQRVVKEQENILEEQSHIRTEIDEREVQSYLEEIMQEIRKKQNKNG